MSLVLEMSVRSFPHDDQQYFVTEGDDAEGARCFRVRTQNNGMMFSFQGESIERTREWKITGETAEEFARLLSTVSVTVCPDSLVGLDGTTVNLKISRGMNSVEFQWWMTLPSQWGELGGLLECLQGSRPAKQGE